MLVEQFVVRPALQQHDLVRVVEALEQLVLLAAVFLQRRLLESPEGSREIGCLAGGDLDRDEVTDGRTGYMPNRACRTASTAPSGPLTSTSAASCRPKR